MTDISKEARLLLLWIRAREARVVDRRSASHEDVLSFIPSLDKAHAELRKNRLVTDDAVSYESTEAGYLYLLGNVDWRKAVKP